MASELNDLFQFCKAGNAEGLLKYLNNPSVLPDKSLVFEACRHGQSECLHILLGLKENFVKEAIEYREPKSGFTPLTAASFSLPVCLFLY